MKTVTLNSGEFVHNVCSLAAEGPIRAKRSCIGVDNGASLLDEATSVSAISGGNDSQNATLFVFHLATERPEVPVTLD